MSFKPRPFPFGAMLWLTSNQDHVQVWRSEPKHTDNGWQGEIIFNLHRLNWWGPVPTIGECRQVKSRMELVK